MPYDGLPTLDDADVTGKRVLLRVAYDVPLVTSTGGTVEVGVDGRIPATIPTIQQLLDAQSSIVICGGWLGRPNGVVVPELRMDPVARRLGELLARPVTKLDDCVGPEVEQAVARMEPGDIVLLENSRFHPGERIADPTLADQVARLGDLCVFDAFGQAHRVHASTTGIVTRMPTVLGPLMVRELQELGRLARPEHPFVVVLGGKKITDKAAVLRRLVGVADRILIGGALANVFLSARGLAVGTSLVESQDIDHTGVDPLAVARELLERAGEKIVQPVDAIAANDALAPLTTNVIQLDRDGVPTNRGLYDIGPETVERFQGELQSAETIFMNGLMGVTETQEFTAGTDAVVRAIGTNRDAFTVAGGGDTEGYLHRRHLADQFSHVSTGGGASLVVVSGQELAVMAALKGGRAQVPHG